MSPAANSRASSACIDSDTAGRHSRAAAGRRRLGARSRRGSADPRTSSSPKRYISARFHGDAGGEERVGDQRIAFFHHDVRATEAAKARALSTGSGLPPDLRMAAPGRPRRRADRDAIVTIRARPPARCGSARLDRERLPGPVLAPGRDLGQLRAEAPVGRASVGRDHHASVDVVFEMRFAAGGAIGPGESAPAGRGVTIDSSGRRAWSCGTGPGCATARRSRPRRRRSRSSCESDGSIIGSPAATA